MASSSVSVDTNTLHTVAVFADLATAERAVGVLLTTHRFAAAGVSAIGNDDAALAAWMSGVLGGGQTTVATAGGGALRAVGPLVPPSGLDSDGVDGLLRKSGFQPHDGRIFARLVERGGVLVAVTSDSRSADPLAVMHAYGGGNAAIGAWRGRL
jgi:hypothetical protein